MSVPDRYVAGAFHDMQINGEFVVNGTVTDPEWMKGGVEALVPLSCAECGQQTVHRVDRSRVLCVPCDASLEARLEDAERQAFEPWWVGEAAA